MVSKDLVKELQTIIFEEYGKKLSFQKVSLIANGLVGYFSLLAKLNRRIINNDDYENDESSGKN